MTDRKSVFLVSTCQSWGDDYVVAAYDNKQACIEHVTDPSHKGAFVWCEYHVESTYAGAPDDET